MDALSDLLRLAKFEGAVYLCSNFTAPWSRAGKIPRAVCAAFNPLAGRIMPFHLVTEGSCWVSPIDDVASPIRVDSGELLVMPRGEAHLIGSSREVLREPAEDLLSICLTAPGNPMKFSHGDVPQTRLICGFFACDDTLMDPVLSGLPRMFKTDFRNDPQSAWLESTIKLAAVEAAEWRAGSAVWLARLSELLFVVAVRRYLEALPVDRTRWVAGRV
ncbi:cupin domain-containing protein, partial [Caballeronia cordobensis]|uniref:cupin domain-containing protein n=1 Tax=Caballeronia cordobensis TaxID=1353886 RepID=UPI0005EE329D